MEVVRQGLWPTNVLRGEIKMFTCPVCFYDKMPRPPLDYNICPCCGTEFGSDDIDHSHAELRNQWVAGGAKWFFRQSPSGWNPWGQLRQAKLVGWLASSYVEAFATAAEEKTAYYTTPFYQFAGGERWSFRTPQLFEAWYLAVRPSSSVATSTVEREVEPRGMTLPFAS